MSLGGTDLGGYDPIKVMTAEETRLSSLIRHQALLERVG